ncbi:MAG: folylpolyglutamate synthase/dihydrofolate synthase family protein, partial [Pseudomonadota bacterium]
MPLKLHNKSDDPVLEKKLDDVLQKLYGFYDQEIELSLGRMERFLKKLGNPHLHLPPVIHIAGTNGKGSTLAALRSLLMADGYDVHDMTSPHLVHPTERIRLCGKPISTEALINLFEECLAINNDEPITFFEIFTAASFLAMSRTPADYAILETGMGGRFDATNVVPHPACTIITTISFDHQEFLGNTIDKIAFEKAGIMKVNVPCVIGHQTYPEAYKVFQKQSKALSPETTIYQCGSEWKIDPQESGAIFTWNEEIFDLPPTNLVGKHQWRNIGAACAAYKIITGSKCNADILSPHHPENPLGTIFWPGRLQKLENTKWNTQLKEGQELWIDGGHNESAGKALAEQARLWQEQDDKPLTIILAMVDRKDPIKFIKPLLPYA